MVCPMSFSGNRSLCDPRCEWLMSVDNTPTCAIVVIAMNLVKQNQKEEA